jgi:hypothetical protein
VVLVTTSLALAAPLPAAAAGSHPSRLVLVVRGASQPTSRAWLGCAPARGTHPTARQACTELAQVNGDITALPPDDTMCMTLYAPVVATATGAWNGRPVRYRHKFGNACELHRATGVVFQL